MLTGNWMSLLKRQLPQHASITWDDVVVGYDFCLLAPGDVRAWVEESGLTTPCCQALLAPGDEALERFESALWAACTEATGKTPRPGGRRWAHAQDRWRIALLKDAMEAPLTAEALAVVVEAIYEHVGCPEDMLGLWTRPVSGPIQADARTVQKWINHREGDLALAS